RTRHAALLRAASVGTGGEALRQRPAALRQARPRRARRPGHPSRPGRVRQRPRGSGPSTGDQAGHRAQQRPRGDDPARLLLCRHRPSPRARQPLRRDRLRLRAADIRQREGDPVRALVLLPLLVLLPAAPAGARDYGQHGAVFPIVERDLLEQIRERLVAMEKSGETGRLNQELKRRTIARGSRPEPVAGLIRAEAPRRWTIDPTVTLDADIRGAKGELIHPAGTRINPLDSVGLRSELIFLDGDDPEQIAWAL